MQSARGDLLALAFVLTGVMYLVRAERWQYLLHPLGHTRFWVAFRTTVIGFAASFILPARAGEVLRPYLLARESGCRRRPRLRRSSSSACSIWWRCSSCSAVFFLAFFAAARRERRPAVSGGCVGALALAPVGAGVLIAMFVMAGHPERLHRLVLRCERVLPARMAACGGGASRRHLPKGLRSCAVRRASSRRWAGRSCCGSPSPRRSGCWSRPSASRCPSAGRSCSPRCWSSAWRCRRRVAWGARTKRFGSA